ncbi:hypothetical protein P5V15_010926 [Pogonomyrmex californicus]
MFARTRNRFLSTLGVTRRLTVVAAVGADHAHVADMGVRRACYPTYSGNAACWKLLDNNVRMSHSGTQPWITIKDERQEMMALWPDVVRDLTDGAKNLRIPDINEWMSEVLKYNVLVNVQYNVRGGQETRSLTVVYAYRLLASNNQLTEDNIRLARILGWCVELQALFLFLDDIQARKLLLRGDLSCLARYYDDFSKEAVYDILMLENSLYYLIRKHFKGKECDADLIETFQDIMWKTIMHQSADYLINTEKLNSDKKLNLDLFTMDRYNSIVEYKMSNYSFLLPVIAAMHFAGIKDPEMFRRAKTILLEMGRLFQVQNDYLAIFENNDVILKDSDIKEGKCAWPIVVALQSATPEQRKIFEKCYGICCTENVRHVKQLFIDLGLPNIYSKYKEETYNLLNEHIQQLSNGRLQSLFLDLLEKLYRKELFKHRV